MTGQVAEFVRALRQAGVRVSLAETLDACECLRHVGVEDRATMRLALHAALVKDPRDDDAFDLLFDRYFRWHRPPRKRREPHKLTHRNEGTAPSREGQGAGRRPQESPARPPAPEAPTPHPPRPPAQPAPSDRPADQPDQPPTRDHRRLLAAAELLKEGMAEARREAERLARQQRQDLWQRDLQKRLSPPEAREVAAEVEKLARKLVSRESLRLRRARRGKVDLKATLARSIRTGGIPFRIVRRRRAVARNKLLVLCDVSGSVWNVAGFLLRLVHLMQNLFSRTRSLVFVDRPVDVTALFQRCPIEEALRRLREHPDLNLNAYSDFGNTFYELLDDFGALIDRDTVVLVLGDARTNQFDPMAWALEDVRRRARRVVWLNPEPPRQWNTHDSALAAYAPFCDAVLPCGTLEQLARAAGELLRP